MMTTANGNRRGDASLPLYPEASPEAALAVWREIESGLPSKHESRSEALSALRSNPIHLREEPRWPGAQASMDILDQLAIDIYAAAETSGFPKRASSESHRQFDAQVRSLVAALDLTPAQAMSGNGGMFRWISLGLVQAVGPWRFPDAFDSDKETSARRLRNPYQDIIGRLWWQHRFFGDRDVSQDLMEGILGRPGVLGRDIRIATAYLDVVEATKMGSEDDQRDFAKRFRIAAAWLAAVELDDATLDRILRMVADTDTPVPDIIEWATRLVDTMGDQLLRAVPADQEIEVADARAVGVAIKAFRVRPSGHLTIGALASMLGIEEIILTEMEAGTCSTGAMGPAVRKLIALGCDFGMSVQIAGA
jgi:hypothetical protein